MSIEADRTAEAKLSGYFTNDSEPDSMEAKESPLSEEWMGILGYTDYDYAPQTKTFNRWQHGSWTFHADDGTVFTTISHQTLTITKAQIIGTPNVVLTYSYRARIKNEGWAPRGSGVIRLDLKDSQGGIVWWDDMYFDFGCGVNRDQNASKRIPIDIFDVIDKVSVHHTMATFWPC